MVAEPSGLASVATGPWAADRLESPRAITEVALDAVAEREGFTTERVDFDLGTEVSGADCIRHLRRHSGREVPAIIMTGHDVRRVQEQVGDGNTPILSKPVQPAELRSLLVALKLKLKAA